MAEPETEESRIPPQVQAAADEADRKIQEQLNADPDRVVQDPVVDPPAIPEVKPEDTETIATLTAKLAVAEQRYLVLQGKYDYEIDHETLNTLMAQVSMLESKNRDLTILVQDGQVKLAAAEKQPEIPAKVELSDTEKTLIESEGYSEDLLDALAKRIGGQPDTTNHSDMAKMSDRLDSYERNQAISLEDRFFSDLATAVPDWTKINGSKKGNIPADPKWAPFLDTIPEYGDQTLLVLLEAAQKRLDVKAVAAIFNGFKATLTVADPVIDPDKEITPIIDPAKRLEPDNSVSVSVPGSEGDKPKLSLAAYKKIMDDFSRNPRMWEGREKEFKALQAPYEAAITAKTIGP